MKVTSAKWPTATLIIVPFILGIVSIIVHDTVYFRFNGKPIESLSQQQWLGRVGTGLAFLVKTLFSATIGTACVQRLWWILRNFATSIKTVDRSMGIISNPLNVFSKRLFREAPAVILLALIAWLMPLGALIAPPTLAVDVHHGIQEQTMRVPAINFSARFDMRVPQAGEFGGAQQLIDRIGLQVALGSSPLPMIASSIVPDGSYSLQFFGPLLQCQSVNQTKSDEIAEAAKLLRFNLSYASWPPYNATQTQPNGDTDLYSNVTVMDFFQWANDIWSIKSKDGESRSVSNELLTYDRFGQNSSAFFVATFTQVNAVNIPVSVYQCNLFNATHDVDFQIKNSITSYSVKSSKVINPTSIGQIDSTLRDGGDPVRSYLSMTDAIGGILVGLIGVDYGYLSAIRTQILITPLVAAKDFPVELKPFEDGVGSRSSKTLGESIEELMMNMTLSLFATPNYLMDPAAFPSVRVTNTSQYNIYQYTRWQLLCAYGAMTALTLFAAFIGLTSLFVNSAAYSNSFSSIVRLTRQSQFDLVIDSQDPGSLPTPKTVESLKVKLHKCAARENEEPTYSIRSVVEDRKNLDSPQVTERRSRTSDEMGSTTESV